jgi:hypothetical protein
LNLDAVGENTQNVIFSVGFVSGVMYICNGNFFVLQWFCACGWLTSRCRRKANLGSLKNLVFSCGGFRLRRCFPYPLSPKLYRWVASFKTNAPNSQII